MFNSKKKFISLITLVILTATSVGILAKPDNTRGNSDPKGLYTSEEMRQLEQIGDQMKSENSDIDIYPVDKIVSKKNIKFDTPPVIKANRTLVPVRAISEAFDANVQWDPEEKEVIISKDDNVIIFELGSNRVFLNGSRVEIDTEAQAFSNRTYVPLRFIAENLGTKIKYDDREDKIELNDDLEDSIEDIEESIEDMEESIQELESVLGEEDQGKLALIKEKVNQLRAEWGNLDIDFSIYGEIDDDDEDDDDEDDEDEDDEDEDEDDDDDDYEDDEDDDEDDK